MSLDRQMSFFADPPRPIAPARKAGERAALRCVAKAVEVAKFDTEGARKFVLSQLVRHGDMSGEALTDSAIKHGYRPHDSRAFGPVFGVLSKRGLIRCVGYGQRAKGHGTAGLRIWGLVR